MSNGEVVSATQAKTFAKPLGVVVTRGGKVVVADGGTLVREIQYGEPQITGIIPEKMSIRGGEKVAIKGKNFAPDTILVISGILVPNVISDTETITFTHHRGCTVVSRL